MHGTTPPEPPQSSQTSQSPHATEPRPRQDNLLESLGTTWLNTELVLYLVIVVLIGLVVLVSDTLGAGTWVSAVQWLTIAYILSRGIAKASRVYEG